MSTGRKDSGIRHTDPADPDVARLLENRLHDPHRVLGRHRHGAGKVVLRAWLPQAVRAELLEPAAALLRVGDTGLFEWTGPAGALPAPYRLRWHDADGRSRECYDPYQFMPQLTAAELEPFNHGHEYHAYRLLGALPVAVDGIDGVRFAVWAPNAQRVSVIGEFNAWDGRCHPLSVRGHSGVWELFVPELPPGVLYKYELLGRDGSRPRTKADPFGRQFEHRPATASVTTAAGTHRWSDHDWLEQRARKDWLREPVSIYEVHLGSWRRGPSGEFLSYEQAAAQLADHVGGLGFTHVELMPVTEHPFDDSWGYQTTGYFAPTRRHGTRDDLRAFVDVLHGAGLGVLLDWVPGHFPKDDHALARFDGSALFEYEDPRKAEHPDWQTLVFNYARNEVRSFLFSSAIHWLEEFHFDGLRVDAVASMLYLDYSRKPGEWAPNAFGGNENLEAIAFLKKLNELTHGVCPGTLTIAEESTAWPGVSRPTYSGGLGFTFKWNMGWMHDTLLFMSKDPVHRRFHHNLLTFGPLYAFSENFVLPLSHDEVVHGKRSLLGKMPGDRWQQFANLRLAFAFQWTYPGKKLLFMGDEFAQPGEWDHRRELDWEAAGQDAHAGVSALVRDLNRLYREWPALHDGDTDPDGFRWLSWEDQEHSVLSYLRRGRGQLLVVLLNFTPVPRTGYRIGVPQAGAFREVLNSDSRFYGGSDAGNPLPIRSERITAMGYADSIAVTLPPLGAVVLSPA